MKGKFVYGRDDSTEYWLFNIEEITKTELTDAQKEYLEFYVEYIDIDIDELIDNPELKEIKSQPFNLVF